MRIVRTDWRFLLGFAAIVLVIAGGVAYLADPAPDGLDAVTQQGCTVGNDDQLSGNCIARNAREHPMANSPLAKYKIGGDQALTGIAGVAGAGVTVLVAGGLFWVLRRRPSKD